MCGVAEGIRVLTPPQHHDSRMGRGSGMNSGTGKDSLDLEFSAGDVDDVTKPLEL